VLMGRPHRAAEGGYVYHVLNRANARMPVFEDEGDYEAFETVLVCVLKIIDGDLAVSEQDLSRCLGKIPSESLIA
jgi:hypothetical protein